MSLPIIKTLFTGCRDSKGQALIETLLLGLVSVVLFMGVLSSFQEYFQKYTQGYFGEYVACLLETGELPFAAPECSQVLETLNQDLNENLESISERTRQKPSSSFRASGRSSSSQRTNQGLSSPFFQGRNSDASSGGGSRSKSSKKKIAKKEKNDKDGYLKLTPRRSGSQDTESYRAERGLSFFQPDDTKYNTDDENITQSTNKKTITQTQANSKKSLKIDVDNTPRKPATSEGDDWSNISFFNILKWLIILALVIIIIIFIGGQLQQISKSL